MDLRRIGLVLAVLGLLFGPFINLASAEASIVEYPLPSGASPQAIAVGPDGALWFTDNSLNTINRIDTNGTINSYTIPTPSSGPVGIAKGTDGALWFTEQSANKIGRITTDGSITEYPIDLPTSFPSHITAGPDGALWFTQIAAASIGRISTDGVITEYRATTGVNGITAGPDGALWFTSTNGNKIGRMSTSGSMVLYPLPIPGSNPVRITAGSDGALWFSEFANNTSHRVGRITTSGTINEYTLPASATGPYAITAGINNDIWITAIGGNELINLATDGTVLGEFPIPSPFSWPGGIVNTADGDVWFTESSSGKIGRLLKPGAASLTLSPSSSDSAVGTNTTLSATALQSNNQPASSITIRFAVSGSTTISGSCVTDTSGVCSFGYIGPQLPGADAITAYADNNGSETLDSGEPTSNATRAWLLPNATAGQVTGGGHITDPASSENLAFGFTAKNNASGLTGQCEIINAVSNTEIKCTSVTSITVNGSSATIFGNANVNDVATTYRIDVTDKTSSGAGNDTFSIKTAGGYTAAGTLTGGNISVR